MQIRAGDVVQITPEDGVFGGCFMQVTDRTPDGVHGFVRVPSGGDEDGRAYYRVSEGEYRVVGRAWWIGGDPQPDGPDGSPPPAGWREA